jgi:hypothetical protein
LEQGSGGGLDEHVVDPRLPRPVLPLRGGPAAHPGDQNVRMTL